MDKVIESVEMELPVESNDNNDNSNQPAPKKVGENKVDTIQKCEICDGEFSYRFFNQHKKTKKHKLAKNQAKKSKRQQQKSLVPSAPLVFVSESKFAREKYYYRGGMNISLQIEQNQNLLTACFSLRFSLDPEYKILKISRNNETWGAFGDIVLETIDQNNEFKREAIDCKQIQNTNDISISDISAETGKFSLRKQFEALCRLRNRKDFDKTFFKLFTLTKLKIEGGSPSFIYDDDLMKNWKTETAKQQWVNRKAVIALFRKNNPLNTTDDPDNIYIFKLLDKDGEILVGEEKILSRFSLFVNQMKVQSLKHQMRMMVENKFGSTRDITEDLVKFFNDYFRMVETDKFNYKMTKRDVLLKIAELLLAPFMLFLESSTESNSVKLWDDTIQKFDIVVVRNEADILNKIYNFINSILKSKIGNVNTSTRSFQINKDDILEENLKFEIFDLFKKNSCKVNLPYLYITLWKAELAPLVLKVENEDNFFLIIKIINFLHAEDLPLKFILVTEKKIHYSYFPDHLKIFTNLEDVRRVDEEFLNTLLDGVIIPFLNFSVCLRDFANLNADFLSKATPDVLLNMLLNDYAFKDVLVPLTDDINNTLVVDDDVMMKIKSYFRSNDASTETKELSYVVNVNGCPTRMEVPPDI